MRVQSALAMLLASVVFAATGCSEDPEHSPKENPSTPQTTAGTEPITSDTADEVVAVPAVFGDLAKNEPAPLTPSRAKIEASPLIGTWTAKRIDHDGAERKDLKGSKFVFSEDKLLRDTFPFEYLTDPSHDPPQIDLGLFGKMDFFGIYKLEGDVLTICVNSLGGAPRPTEFATKPKDSRELIVLQRLPKLPMDVPDADLDPTLKATIADAVRLLEAGKDEEFLNTVMIPETLAELKNRRWDEAVRNFKTHRVGITEMLQTLHKLNPAVSDQGATIRFDLSNVPLKTPVPTINITFIKRDNRWYLSMD